MLRLLRLFIHTFFTTLWARLRRGAARPSWGFQFEWVVAFLRRDFEESSTWAYPELRRELNRRRYPRNALRRVTRRRETLGQAPATWFSPPQSGPGVVLFFHGGSYIFGSIETTHAELAAELAERSGTAVVGIDYRLAPEHPYPAALEDALAAFDALVARGHSPRDLVVAGDSAGGNLALCLQLALRDAGREQARAAVLFSPWLDLSASRASCRSADSLDYGQTSFILRHARDFAGSLPLTDPRVSPLGADLSELSPLFVLVGGAERLFDEGGELVAASRRAGVEAELWVASELPHSPPALSAFHPAAAASFEAAARFVRAALARR